MKNVDELIDYMELDCEDEPTVRCVIKTLEYPARTIEFSMPKVMADIMFGTLANKEEYKQ